jgi:Chromo (CHRromatin Organisation MOdifier) domain
MLSPLPVHIVDGELEYTVEAIMAHKVVKGGKSKNGTNRSKVLFLTAWEGYDRAHDSWEPGEMLQDTEALELYLQAVVRRGEVLPPEYSPEGTQAAAASNKRARETSTSNVAPGSTKKALEKQQQAVRELSPDYPPPAAALAPYNRSKRVTFQLGS